MAKLNAKHLKSLELLKQNKYSVSEVARMIGFDKSHLHSLIHGEGPIGLLFQSQYKKIAQVIEERTAQKMTVARERLINKLFTWIEAVKDPGGASQLTHKQMIDTLNALSKMVPTINVQSYTWTSLQGEDLINEFNRITGLARSILDRKRIPSSPEGGQGQVPPRGEADDAQGSRLQDPEI